MSESQSRPMVGLQGFWGRLRVVSAYAFFPMLGAATPLLALPAVSNEFGATGWASIAVGQSVGAAASVAVELGWGLTGPQAVAASDRTRAARLFAASLKSRGAVVLGVIPLAVLAVLILAPAHLVAASLAAAAMALSGLTANWYYLGLGRPSRIFWTDALPRLVTVLCGVISISYLGAPLAVFALWLVVGYLSSPVIAAMIERPRREDFEHAERVIDVLRRQRVALAGRGLSAVYIGLPVALVQAWTPAAVPAFAAAERLMRMGLLVLQSVPNSLQRAIGLASKESERLRPVARKVLAVQMCLGALAGSVCALALPRGVELIFSGEVVISNGAAQATGAIVMLTCISRATGMILVARSRVGWVTASAATAAVSAVSLLAVLPGEFGPTGALVSLAAAESMALAVQVVGLAKPGKRTGPRPPVVEAPPYAR